MVEMYFKECEDYPTKTRQRQKSEKYNHSIVHEHGDNFLANSNKKE